MNILLDYFFPITAIVPTPAASTAFLKQVCVVVSPKGGVEAGVLHLCTSMAAVTALTDNTEAQQLFDAGLSRVYILPMDDLDLAEALEGHGSDFYTLLVSSDFADSALVLAQATGNATITSYANLVDTGNDTVTVAGVAFTAQTAAVTAGGATFQAATSNNATAASLAAQINAHTTTKALVTAVANSAIVTITAKLSGPAGNAFTLAYHDNGTSTVGATVSGATLAGGSGIEPGEFTGVIGVSSSDDDFLADQAAIQNRCAFHILDSNGAKNMFYAFGKLLSNSLDWLNQQYITMPVADDVTTLGQCNNLFDSKISFVISDDQYGQRLALLACGGQAIVAPYIERNLEIDMQSEALQYVSANQPGYTHTQAALLEDELQKVIDGYVEKQWIEVGIVEIKLEQDNFVASGYIDISEPKALWRIFGQLKQTL